MSKPGETEIWTAARLKARLAALRGLAPAPRYYVVWRATSRPGTPEIAGYELPAEPGRQDETAFERWLRARDLAAAERLSVSVLVIRERLDEAGLLRDAALERRRGGVEGPYYGNVARVTFSGAANGPRRYRAAPDGSLTELPAEAGTAAASAATEAAPVTLAPIGDAEAFAGEDAAVHTYLGPSAIILGRRAPTATEEAIGLSGVIRARRRDHAEVGCGVGWHGATPFVLAADFPRLGAPLTPPPDLEAAVKRLVETRGLVRHETRVDEQGYCVIARERGRDALVAIRLGDQGARIDAYAPGRGAPANEEQHRWMTYAETREARAILDSWREGAGDEIAVLTIDPDQQAWRHVIDADGVEVSRQSANDAAVAVLHRERIRSPGPPPASAGPDAPVGTPDTRVARSASVGSGSSGSGSAGPASTGPGALGAQSAESAPSGSGSAGSGSAVSAAAVTGTVTRFTGRTVNGVLATPARPDVPSPTASGGVPAGSGASCEPALLDRPSGQAAGNPVASGARAPADSLLVQLLAWSRAVSLLADVQDHSGVGQVTVPQAALDRLAALKEPLSVLNAGFSIGSLERLLIRARTGAMSGADFALATRELVARIRDELAMSRIVTLPASSGPKGGEPPFGTLVEMHFPAAAFDIEEAVHCLALRRSTAAMLHAMKVLRHGLRSLQRLLSTPDLSEFNWARLIMTVRGVAGDHPDLVEALVRVGRAWRAPGLPPADKYTEEEAEIAMQAVAGFMRGLAEALEARGEAPGD